MESQPQNLEFRINPENFHPCSTNEIIPLEANIALILLEENSVC